MYDWFGPIVIVIILALLILIIYYSLRHFINFEHMVNIEPVNNPTWCKNDCSHNIMGTLRNVLDEQNIKQVADGDLYIPCSYDEISKEIDKINPHKDQRVHIIDNADHLAAKDYLWKMLVQHHGLPRAQTLMPNTYVLYLPSDLQRLKDQYDPKKIYIMKKNIQRQQGLHITNSYDEIMKLKNSYVVVQELLTNPYMINGRKINMRFYMLVVCNQNNIDIYVYDNGFMYYTKKPYKMRSLELDRNITTGYIDRSVYDSNPLTHSDFKKYLDSRRVLTKAESRIAQQGLQVSNVIFNRIYGLLREVALSSVGNICSGDKLKQTISFQMFGADVAVEDDLSVYILEINKGPNISGNDDADYAVKKSCVKDMLRVVGVVNEPGPNGWIKVLDKEGDRLKVFI